MVEENDVDFRLALGFAPFGRLDNILLIRSDLSKLIRWRILHVRIIYCPANFMFSL